MASCKKKQISIFLSFSFPAVEIYYLQVGNNVGTVLWLLETSEGHLGARNILLGVFKVLKEAPVSSLSTGTCENTLTYVKHALFVPEDTLVLVGIGVRVTSSLTRLAAKDTVEVRTDLVGTTLYNTMSVRFPLSHMTDNSGTYSFDGVALGTASLEELGTSSSVTFRDSHLFNKDTSGGFCL